MRDDLVDALKQDSGQLQEIAEGFRNQMQGISIVSCLETMATPPFREPVRLSFSPLAVEYHYGGKLFL
jgi:hypothetical protein